MTADTKPENKYPARKVLLAENEELLRAIVEEEWHDGRGSPSIFRRPNTSVTRINEIGLQAAIAQVKQDVEKPGNPQRDLRGAGRISVELVKKISQTPVPINNPPPDPRPGSLINLQVWEEKIAATDDKPGNPYHAEIVAYEDSDFKVEKTGKISLGYSRMLSKALHVYAVDAQGAITGESCARDWTVPDEPKS